MKYLIILTLMCNACYGQYIDSFVIVYKMQSGNTEVVTRNAKPTYDMADSVWLNYDETWIVYRWKPIDIDSFHFTIDESYEEAVRSGNIALDKNGNIIRDIQLLPHYDSATIYGNDPPVYHRKKDTVLTFVFYVDTTRQMIITNDYHTLIKPCDNCMVSYKQDTTYYRDHMIQWTYLYSVRELHNYNENGIVNGQMQYQWRVMGENGNNYWKHLYYLNSNKEPLSGNVVVWQSMEVK